MDYNNINICNIEFSDIKKQTDIQYYNIYYNKSNFIFNTNNSLKFEKYIENNDHYIITFKINNIKLYNFIENINKKIVDHIFKNCNIIFGDIYDFEKIKNLFFSNIEVINDNKYLYIKTHCIDKFLNCTSGQIVNLNIKILGVWIFKNMFGITFEDY